MFCCCWKQSSRDGMIVKSHSMYTGECVNDITRLTNIERNSKQFVFFHCVFRESFCFVLFLLRLKTTKTRRSVLSIRNGEVSLKNQNRNRMWIHLWCASTNNRLNIFDFVTGKTIADIKTENGSVELSKFFHKKKLLCCSFLRRLCVVCVCVWCTYGGDAVKSELCRKWDATKWWTIAKYAKKRSTFNLAWNKCSVFVRLL